MGDTGPRVVVALHYQNEVLHPEGLITLGIDKASPRTARVVAAAGRLLEGARAAGDRVIHVRMAFPPDYAGMPLHVPIFAGAARLGAMKEGSWGARFLDGLGPVGDEEVVSHCRVNAFFETRLDRLLEACRPARLVLAGVATNSVVEHTARHAADMGYAVFVPEDACSASRVDVHEAALFNIGLVGMVGKVEDLYPGIAP